MPQRYEIFSYDAIAAHMLCNTTIGYTRKRSKNIPFIIVFQKDIL
jgi:hypothetical protein